MPRLLESQDAFLHAIVRREIADVARQIADGVFTPSERLDVYRNTFFSTLTNALRISFPAVYRLVGDEFSEAAAQCFIEVEPPRSAYLNSYGGGFADFLAQFPAVSGLHYLPDVARLEWVVNAALHADDTAPLDPESLAQIASVLPEHVAFVAHPSVKTLRLDYPARAIWQAVLDEDDNALSAIDLRRGPELLLIERSAGAVEVSLLAEAEWRFTNALCAGESFAAAMEIAPDGDIPLFLARHIAAGRLIGFHLSDSLSEKPL